MAYSILSLSQPKRTSGLARAAGVNAVFNPPSRPRGFAASVPSYDQQIGGLAAANPAPQFNATNYPIGGSATPAAGGAPTDYPIGGSAVPPAPATPGGSAAAPAAAGPPALPGGGVATAGGINVDYTSDPILLQAQAAYQASVDQAQADADAQDKAAQIRYNGKGNPFSTVAELDRWNSRALGNVDTTTNRNNLYFSSTRARDRGLQAEDFTRQSARTANQYQDLIASIARGLVGQKQSAMAGLLGSEESAYNRALQMALQQQYAAGSTPPAPTPTAPSSVAGAAAAGSGSSAPPSPSPADALAAQRIQAESVPFNDVPQTISPLVSAILAADAPLMAAPPAPLNPNDIRMRRIQ